MTLQVDRLEKTGFTPDYFRELGMPEEIIPTLVEQWNRKQPQTLKDVRAGVIWERKNREASAAEHIK